ncbi:MAG: hypothetical protein K2R98_03765 [Gemmataceae bacterium]|nr:hypothetical protein [Gemmataceae bacterium]
MSIVRLGLWSVVGVALSFVAHAEPPVAAEKAATDLAGDPLPRFARARLGTLRFRHGSTIASVRYLSDGKSIVTIGQDQSIRVWEADTGRERYSFVPPQPQNPQFNGLGGLGGFGGGLPFAAGSNGLVVSHNARLAAVNEQQDQTVRILDLATGKLLHKLGPVQTNGNGMLTFTPDDSALAIIAIENSEDDGVVGKIRLVDVKTGKDIRTFASASKEAKPADQPKQPGFVPSTVQFSPNGKLLFSNGNVNNSPTQRTWDTESGKELPTTEKKSGQTASVLFSPDSKLLAELVIDPKSPDENTFIKLWDPRTGDLKQELGGMPPITSAFFSPDGKFVAVVCNNGGVIQWWDVATGKKKGELIPSEDTSLAIGATFARDSKTIAIAQANQKIRLIDVATAKEVRVLKEFRRDEDAFGGPPSPDGGNESVLSVSPDGKFLAAASGKLVRRWELSTGKHLPAAASGGAESDITGLALTSSGHHIAGATRDNNVILWDAASSRERKRIEGPPAEEGLVFGAIGSDLATSPDGKSLAVSWFNGKIQLLEMASGKEIRSWQAHEFSFGNLRFTPNGKILVSGGFDGRVAWWDATNAKLLRQLDDFVALDAENVPAIGLGFVNSIATSHDSKLIAAVGNHPADGYQIRLWEVSTGKLRRKISIKVDMPNGFGPPPAAGVFPVNGGGPSNPVTSMTFMPDSKVLAWSQGSTVYLYDLVRGRPLRQMGNQESYLARMALSPDGKVVAGASINGTIRLWEASTGTVLRDVSGHRGAVTSLAFTSDGRTLVSGGMDTTILLWDLPALLMEDAEAKRSAAELTALWKQLGEDDAESADVAIRTLSTAKDALPFLKERLKPVQAIDAAVIARWVEDLSSNHFEVRRRATVELEKLGPLAESALRKRLGANPPLEETTRIDQLLEKLTGPVTEPDLLRSLRAVESLEHMATPEAKSLLEALARGASGARQTEEARAALERLAK